MPVPATASDFLTMVRRSGLIPAKTLESFVLANQSGLPNEANATAAQLVQGGLLTKFQAQQILKGRFKNFAIGRYRVLEPLGVGGMSRVYLCEHTAMGHRVAMKLLPMQTGADPSLAERFFREARAVAALNHPNIVRAHDVAEESGKFLYLIMDFVDGVNLHDLVAQRSPLTPERAAHYIAQTAEGLQHIHEAGLVHRDLKPGNLLLDRTGTVKILDLGLARFNAPEPSGSITARFDDKAILGTADFLSPEQAIQSSSVDIRADIYSLGATMYFLLAGRPPFNCDNLTQKLLAHQMKKAESLLQLRPELPKELVAVVEKMMEKRAEDRYQQPVDVAEALAPWTQTAIAAPDESELPVRGAAASGSGSQISGRLPRPGSGVRRSSVAGGPLSVRTLAPGAQMSPSAIFGIDASPKRRKLTLGGIAAGAAALSCLLMWLFLGGKPLPSDRSTGPALTPNGPRDKPDEKQVEKPTGAHVVGVGGFATVAAAVAAAKPGDRIVVLGPTHEEALALTNPPANLTIETFPARETVAWRAPANHPADKPLCDLNNCRGLKLRGFAFEGLDKLPDLIGVRGLNPGLILEDLQLRGFGRAGVRFAGGSGGVGQPIKLSRIRLSTAREVQAAVAFDRGPTGGSCRYVQINTCRFEGPFRAAIAVNGPTTDLEVLGNRFHRVADGVQYAKHDPAIPLQLTLAGNTFCEVAAAIHFRTMTPADSSRITVIDNLFLKTAKLAVLSGARGEPAEPSQWVWHDEKLANDLVPPAERRYFRKTFDLAKPPEKSAALDIGCAQAFRVWVNGIPVGASGHRHFNQRVYAFDIRPHLKAGKNVVAVEGENTLDPFDPSRGLTPALTARVRIDDRVVAATDDTWKSAIAGPDGWTAVDFADAAWTPAVVWPAADAKPLWAESVWDVEIARQLGATRLPLTARGNVRDHFSGEAYPLLDSQRGSFPGLATDSANDALFLRYDRASPLANAGSDRGPVGCPPVD